MVHIRSFPAEAVELCRRWRQAPGIRPTAHAGTGNGHTVAVALPGVGREIDAVGMKPLNATIARNDGVIVPRANPVVTGGSPVEIEGGGHGLSDSKHYFFQIKNHMRRKHQPHQIDITNTSPRLKPYATNKS